MRLTFDRAGVERLLAELRQATSFKGAYGQPDEPALWLVGDEGIYLIQNGVRDGTKPDVVYAQECDPTKMDFDEWWAAKNAIFGGDDGVEQIPLATIETAIATYKPGENLKVDMTPNSYAITYYVTKPVAKSVIASPDAPVNAWERPKRKRKAPAKKGGRS